MSLIKIKKSNCQEEETSIDFFRDTLFLAGITHRASNISLLLNRHDSIKRRNIKEECFYVRKGVADGSATVLVQIETKIDKISPEIEHASSPILKSSSRQLVASLI